MVNTFYLRSTAFFHYFLTSIDESEKYLLQNIDVKVERKREI